MDDAIRHENEALQTMLAARDGMPGADPSLESARLKAAAQVEQEAAEEVRPQCRCNACIP